ncbi:recombinase family protein [Kibdelosporangium philippinense]|nr:recombinase family protein [Kibdelosporangium philippinense]
MARSATAQRTKKAAMTTLGEDVRVGVYVRRSTDDEHQPYSIEAQDTRLAAYIDSQPGWRLVKRFPDDASGASIDKRPGLAKAMAAARAGLIDVLLVYRVDRFSRNLRDMVTLLDELDQVGVVFRSATEPFDTSTPMGRMLVQMLGMFAQFERDTIIDRVIAGMERKAAKGKWKGGRRPFGYNVNKETHKLIPHKDERAIVRLIFELYTRKRLGGKVIARVLNERGHRTTTGGRWSAYQVLRVLANRVYIGELSFRDIITSDCHDAIVDLNVFEEAQQILEARGENYSHRAANGSDYQLTGKMRCPQCNKAMVGANAHGKTKVYRYYICHNRNRYDTTKCDATRINADSIETAVLNGLSSFYRDHYQLIADAVTRHQAQHLAGEDNQRAELATVEAELTKTNQAIDRYLNAFENGTLEEDDLAARLATLKTKTKQLRARRDELADQLADAPQPVPKAALVEVADYISEIIASGTDNQRKALIETLIAEIKITAADRIVPIFRIPQPRSEEAPLNTTEALTTSKPLVRASKEGVRTMTNLVGRVGLEPTAKGL